MVTIFTNLTTEFLRCFVRYTCSAAHGDLSSVKNILRNFLVLFALAALNLGAVQPLLAEEEAPGLSFQDKSDYQGYEIRLRRKIFANWKKASLSSTPVLSFQVTSQGQVVDPKIVRSSSSEEKDQSAIEALKTIEPIEVPPAAQNNPVILDLGVQPWTPMAGDSAPTDEETLATIGFLYEAAGFAFSTLLLLTAIALLFIKKFSRAMSLAVFGIALAVVALASPGLIFLVADALRAADVSSGTLVNVLRIAGFISFAALLSLPVVVAQYRGKMKKDLAWIVSLSVVSLVMPLTWAAALFLSIKGEKQS